jgi:hypothetical protein
MAQSVVLAVIVKSESVETDLSWAHVSNATEQQASSLGEKLDAVFFVLDGRTLGARARLGSMRHKCTSKPHQQHRTNQTAHTK